MTTMYDFGVRSIPACGDCYADGHCSMNCCPKIVTSFVDPPIPTGFEWIASYNGDEPNEAGAMPCGHGPTKQAAIADLQNTHPR